MKKWGILVTAFYAGIILFLIVPGTARLTVGDPVTKIFSDLSGLYRGLGQEPMFWVWLAILIGGEGIMFLSVDVTTRRFRPRQHIFLSEVAIMLALALLSGAAFYSLLAARYADRENFWGDVLENHQKRFLLLLVLWLFWGIVFYIYARGSAIPVTRLVGWLLKGSVLELLIAVPCHVIVRRRHDCSAPILTGYGIATGLAVMLMTFGPGVLFLYRKRLKQYEKPTGNGTQREINGS